MAPLQLAGGDRQGAVSMLGSGELLARNCRDLASHANLLQARGGGGRGRGKRERRGFYMERANRPGRLAV